MKGWIAPWTGRFYSLWDTGYAKKYIPIIASVSEHQPTAWPSFFMDLHILIALFPAGVYLCFNELRDEHIFVIIYAVVASYFAGVMVRLMLTLTPVVCVSSAVALSSLFEKYMDPIMPDEDEPKDDSRSDAAGEQPGNGAASSSQGSSQSKKSKKSTPPAQPAAQNLEARIANLVSPKSDKRKGIFGLDTRVVVILNAILMLSNFVFHCTWVTSNAYSSPSVVLSSNNPDGSKHIIDDFREAYYWLRQNTPETAVVMSWWDYGYQIAGMADRPTLVDNNTWNNSE